MKKNNVFNMKLGLLLLIPVIAIALITGSCKKIIELDPYNQVSEATAFTSPALIELSVMGMYQAAQRGDYAGGLRGYPFGAASVQQGDNRGEDVVNIATFYRNTYKNEINPTTANNVYMWSDSYRLINRCNIIIEGVQAAATAGTITAEVANAYEGEARLLRAATYHELLIHFSFPYKHSADASHQGVPYHDKSFTTQAAIDEGFVKGRETVAFVYGKILEDLVVCETNLPLKAGRTGNTKITRATKGAAIAYKQRIYQHMWNMGSVITEGLKLVPGGALAGEYTLGAQPWTCFQNDYSNSESIFGMENSATNNPGVNAALASQYKRRLLVSMSPIIWRNSKWLADDKRRKSPEMVFTTNTMIFTNKYDDDVNYFDASPMIRYAEVLLNLAEAYARNNDVVNGLKYLNMVRDRSLASVATQSYVAGDFANNVALLGAILVERRIEFAMEGRRWPDIHRLQDCPHFPIVGIPAKVANGGITGSFTLGTEFAGPYEVGAIPYDDFRFLWPIPLIETNANPTLAGQQNPGW